MTSQSPSPALGRLTALALGFVVLLCVAMIGGIGYVKFMLDRSEAVQSASEPKLLGTLEPLADLRRALGYSGFVGTAQSYVTTHDAAQLTELHNRIKDARTAFDHLPESTPADTRRDLQAVIDSFSALAERADKISTDATQGALTQSDLVPLYATLPLLDGHIQEAMNLARAEAQGHTQFWGMILTLTGWAGVLLAFGLVSALYLTVRDKQAAPLQALTQSVRNLSRGDMRTPIWGMERTDMVGELARTLDLARHQFSQMPDMTLISDQGPIRLRFEGGTKSLFEAMMRVISRDSEQAHEKTQDLNTAIAQQKEQLALVIARVEAVLQNVEKHAVQGDHQVRHALRGLVGSAQSLKNAQEHTTDQLSRLFSFIQDRAQNLSDATQIAGKQLAQALQSISLSQHTLKSSADQGDEIVRRLSSTADSLGERMFGAVNLLQASGKVLTETTEQTQVRLNEAIESLNQSIAGLANPAAALSHPTPTATLETSPATIDPRSLERLEQAIATLDAAQTKMDLLLDEQTQAARAQIDLLSTHSSGLLLQTSTSAQTMSAAADKLRDEQAHLHDRLTQLAAALEDKIGAFTPPVTTHHAAPHDEVPELLRQLQREIQVTAAPLHEKLQGLQQEVAVLAAELRNMPEQDTTGGTLSEQLRDHWYQIAGQIEATRNDLLNNIQSSLSTLRDTVGQTPLPAGTNDMDHELREAREQMEQQTRIMAELVTTLGLLDAHMQDIRSQVSGLRQRAG